MAEVTGEGGLMGEVGYGQNDGNARVVTPLAEVNVTLLTMLASFKEGKGLTSRRRALVRLSLDADEFINLLHESDPVKVELNRLENEVGDKDREMGEAQAGIRALRLSERLRKKGVEEGNEKNKKEKAGISLVDLAYRKAKAVKAMKKAVDACKFVRKVGKKSKHLARKTQSRTEEMQEPFQTDVNEKKHKRILRGGAKRKSSFKSKSRCKRKYNKNKVPFLCVLYYEVRTLCFTSFRRILNSYHFTIFFSNVGRM